MKILNSLLTATLIAGSTVVLTAPAQSSQEYSPQTVRGQSITRDASVSPTRASSANATYYATGGRRATVFDPPSNVRNQPNGKIVCTITTRRQINVYRYYDASYQWISTDACGPNTYGVIHVSQIRF